MQPEDSNAHALVVTVNTDDVADTATPSISSSEVIHRETSTRKLPTEVRGAQGKSTEALQQETVDRLEVVDEKVRRYTEKLVSARALRRRLQQKLLRVDA